MRKKIIIGSILFFILLFTQYITANAQIASQSTQVNSGEQFSITVTSDISLSAYTIQANYPGLELVNSSGGTGAGTATISNALASGGTTSLATFTFRAPTVSKDTQYTITFSGSGMGDENLNPVANSQSTSTITVKAPSNPGNGGETTSKSTEARLSNLGITPNDFSGFRRDTTTYTVEVPNDVSKVKIYATPLDSKATVSGTGTVTLKEGANSFKITVTAEAGNTKTYTLNITRVSATDDTDDSENEESEARLKNLGIKPEEYDFSGFKRDTTSYSVEVPNEVTEIEVYAEPVSSKAQITGTGTITLNEGVNKVEVKVTAEDGTEMVYTLEITRVASTTNEEEPETNKELGLSSLNIKNFSLSPKFDPETYEYTLGIRNDIDSLEIEAKANNSNATVEIVGNENLKDGENIITILVSNAETEEYATYQIIVNKNAESEIAGTVDWTNPSTWGLKEKIIVGVAVLLVIVIIVAIIIKIKLAKKEDEDLDLPGAEELDRALAEHQELADETESQNEEFIETSENDNQYNDYYTNSVEQEKPKSDIERAQEYFESYTKRKGKHF